MEQETKFSIKDSETADLIWDAITDRYADGSKGETLELNAAYYDSSDRILMQKGIALRTRCEGDVCFATMKWGSSPVMGGLHQHEEVNIPIEADSCFTVPPAELFDADINGKNLYDILEGRELEVLFETRVTRRRIMVHHKKSVMEISIDQGTIIAGEKTEDISEIEIELYSGDLSDVLNLTDRISAKYGLEPEEKTKYARAMTLLGLQ